MIPQSVALPSIVAAYGVVFAAIFIFILLMISRQKKLEKRLRELQNDVKDVSKR